MIAKFLCTVAFGCTAMTFACSSATSTGGAGGTSGSPSTSGGPAASCTPAPGTYKLSFTKTAGDPMQCPALADQDQEIKDTAASDAGVVDSPGCKTTTNSATCESTTSCNQTMGGITSTSESTGKFSTTGYSGTSKSKIVDAMGKVLSDCAYSFTATKK
jgi:hypothetical protein